MCVQVVGGGLCVCVCEVGYVCAGTVCAKKTLPLPFNETERNGPFNETERAVHDPFFIRSSSVRGPCVFSVRFESVFNF